MPSGRAGSTPVFRTHIKPEWLELAYTAVLKAADFGHKGSSPFSGIDDSYGDEREIESGLSFKQLICEARVSSSLLNLWANAMRDYIFGKCTSRAQFLSPDFFVGCSSTGRTPHCDCGSCEFKSRQPTLFQSQRRKENACPTPHRKEGGNDHEDITNPLPSAA